jgi:hypothetical protein
MKDLTILLGQEKDITTRYRITSLVRRRPLVNLYFGVDGQQPASQEQSRMVAIRDIDLTALSQAALIEAVKLAQLEYDLLRRSDISHLAPATELSFSQSHLYLVMHQPPSLLAVPGGNGDKRDGRGNRSSTRSTRPLWTGRTSEKQDEKGERLITLQDYLQSGRGLPSTQDALRWIEQLGEAVVDLHRRHITLGDLDPFTVLYSGDLSDPGTARLTLLISWLPGGIRALVPPSMLSMNGFFSYFAAPEVTQGTVNRRSDVYSLGAILYLLLTGMPPGESTSRSRSRQSALHPPHEINGQVSQQVSECVMQALELQPDDRFSSVPAFMAALSDPHYHRPIPGAAQSGAGDEDGEVETVRIFPLSWKDVERWRAAHRSLRAPTAPEDQPPAAIPETPATSLDTPPSQAIQTTPSTAPGRGRMPRVPRLPDLLPVVSAGLEPFRRLWQARRALNLSQIQSLQSKWVGQFKQALLGEQQPVVTAAIIETPLRVQPGQMFTLRIHMMGRNQPGQAAQRRARDGEVEEISLSRLVAGDTVQVEVRSALEQNLAFLVQRASVTIPAEGYVAEVTIPMRLHSSTSTSWRDRLHIIFMDEHRRPLYEKPFAVEIFVSNHVKPGNEGHNVLTIPF